MAVKFLKLLQCMFLFKSFGIASIHWINIFLFYLFSEVLLLDTSTVISGDLNWTKKIVPADPPDPLNGGVSRAELGVRIKKKNSNI